MAINHLLVSVNIAVLVGYLGLGGLVSLLAVMSHDKERKRKKNKSMNCTNIYGGTVQIIGILSNL